MAYLTISTSFNIEATGVTIDGTKCTNSYSLDLIKGPVQIKFDKAIYSTYNNGTRYVFIPKNTYVNMGKDTAGLLNPKPARYVYSARTTTSVSNYSFPSQTVTYYINIPDLTKTITVTGTTTVGSLATSYVRLSATTTGTIAQPTYVRTVYFDSAVTFLNKCMYYISVGDTVPSGYQIYETRHLSNDSACTYIYSREMEPYMPYYNNDSYNRIYFFSPYSGSTFEIHRMGERLGVLQNRTYKNGSLTGTSSMLISHNTLSGGTKSTVLTNKLFKKAYPRLDESSFQFGWTNSDDGEVFTEPRAQDFIASVEENQEKVFMYSDTESTDWAVRCNEVFGTSRCSEPATAQYGSVINTEDAFISISSAYTTSITFQGNQTGFELIPFLTGLGNKISLEFSGNSSAVVRYLMDNHIIENGFIFLKMGSDINVDSTTYMTVEAYSPKYDTSSITRITIYTDAQSCSDCDYCNYSTCQYT